MKFSLDDFLQLDVNGLLSVNGGTDSLETGASYVVFMVDDDNELESHTGIIMNGGAFGYCFIDNSSSNDIPGTETHKGSSLNGVLSPYSRYENMYFVKLK